MTKFNPQSIITELDGDPVIAGQKPTGGINEDGEPIVESVNLTLGMVMAVSLQQPDAEMPAEERIRRVKLALELVDALDDNKTLEWKSEDIVLAKELCLKTYPAPVIYYRVEALLESNNGAEEKLE